MAAALFALAAFQAASAIQQADLIRENADITREIADMNAKYAMVDANQALEDGQRDIARYDTTITRTIGEQKVGFAADNVDAGYGTAAEVAKDSQVAGYLNKLDIANQANARALGLRQQSRMIALNGQMGYAQGTMNAAGTESQGFASAAGTAFRAWTETQTAAGRGGRGPLGSSNYSRK